MNFPTQCKAMFDSVARNEDATLGGLGELLQQETTPPELATGGEAQPL
jgi:hypothetical protein